MSDREEFKVRRVAGLTKRQATRHERALEREAETLAAEVEPWLQECGSCDYGLAMGCTCPKGDYRVVLLKVWQAYKASRRLVAEEIAQAITQAGDKRSPDRHSENEEKRDHGSTRYASYLDAARIAREIGSEDAS